MTRTDSKYMSAAHVYQLRRKLVLYVRAALPRWRRHGILQQ